MDQAFGRLKGRWKIMDGQCMLSIPVFARHVAMVCCRLHNVCERDNCAYLSLAGFQKKVLRLKPCH